MSPASPFGNGVVDKFVNDFPEQYPNGDKPKYIAKVDGVHRNKKPVVNWAKDMSRNVSKCLGVFVCPHFHEGCQYRVRPQVPRRGPKTTYGVPSPNEKDSVCWMHGKIDLVRMTCKCTWTIEHYNEQYWVINHIGKHNHPAPPPIRASHKAKNQLSDIVTHNTQAKPTQLTIGISGGSLNTVPPIGELDPKFQHNGYVASLRQGMLKALKKEDAPEGT